MFYTKNYLLLSGNLTLGRKISRKDRKERAQIGAKVGFLC